MDTEKLCSVAISIKHKYVYAIGKNPTPTLTRDKAKMEYTSGRQPSSYELTFRVHFKMHPYLDPLNRSPTILSTYQAQKCLGVREGVEGRKGDNRDQS
ncbi:hypothetical protein GmHk_06G015834 [Glycine max]|nr:hypothetical protein GmHk_06G015834 [Glycine max]